MIHLMNHEKFLLQVLLKELMPPRDLVDPPTFSLAQPIGSALLF